MSRRVQAPRPSTVLRAARLEGEMLTCAYIRETLPSLMPGWDLEAIADEILGLTPREGQRRTDHRRRSCYTEAELTERNRRARVEPVGRHIERFAYADNGELTLSVPEGSGAA